MSIQKDILQLNTLTDLRACPYATGSTAFLISKNVLGDNLGGFYMWDGSATASEDAYMNVIISNLSPTGRWLRIFQKAKVYPHGILVTNGGIKTFYASTSTNASGDATLNLTDDNTATGNALFTEVWFNNSKSTMTSSNPSDAITSYVKSLSGNLKQTTHGYYKANPLLITISLFYSPLISVGASVSVQFKVEGI